MSSLETVIRLPFEEKLSYGEVIFYCKRCGWIGVISEIVPALCPKCGMPVEKRYLIRLSELSSRYLNCRILFRGIIEGEGSKKALPVKEWFKSQDENEPGLKILSYGKVKEGREGGYGWIERLLEKPVDDGRRRLLWLVIAPYLVNVKGFPIDEAIHQAYNYLLKCSEIRPIREDPRKLAEYYVNYAARTGLKPVSLQTLKTRNEYSELWKILKPTLSISV